MKTSAEAFVFEYGFKAFCTLRLRLLVREKYMFPDCSGAATGDGVNFFFCWPR